MKHGLLVILFATLMIGQAQGGEKELDDSVGRGLDYLATQQQVDGSLSDNGPKIAITALGLLDFLAAGHVPELGKYGTSVRSAVDFLIQQAPPDGYFGRVDASRMYGHAISTLALAEALGVEPSAERRQKINQILRKAARVLIEAQRVKKSESFAGGWRYEPDGADSDISLSGWCALALRACAAVGVEVPGDSAGKAVDFVLKCHNAEGGFGYQPGSGPLLSATGTAVVCLSLLERSTRPERDSGIRYLREHPFDEAANYPYYTMYYVTQAAYQADEATVRSAAEPIAERLLKLQGPDGSWPQSRSGEEPGVAFATTMALLTLEVRYRLLPVYQR